MSKINKNIIRISLIFAVLVILAHSFIPHDHHFDNHTDLLQHHHNESNRSGSEPIHCHYLNNIDFDKARINTISHIIKEFPVVFTIVFSDLCSIDLNHQTNNFINANDNLPDYPSLISISPTRGSPLL